MSKTEPFRYELVDPHSVGPQAFLIYDPSDRHVATCYTEPNAQMVVTLLNQACVTNPGLAHHFGLDL